MHFVAKSSGRAHREGGSRPDQALAALRGFMNVLGSRFSRFSARFSFIDIFAAFFTSRPCGVLPDIRSSLPLDGWR
jgi:hypothetical protein